MKPKKTGSNSRDDAEKQAVNPDITELLKEWGYDEEDSVRRLRAEDGREILQVRLPLGVEQYEINGRPDGYRPKQQESWLHFYRKRADHFAHEFVLDERALERLAQEGLLYYYRYLRFFQMKEYRLCERDTRRNLRLLEFVSSHSGPEEAEGLEQYRPYILRMNVMARALGKIQYENDIEAATDILEDGMEEVKSLPEIEDNQVFEFEKVRSLQSLADLHSQLTEHLPKPRHVELEKLLEEAVEKEDYERAATLRDELRRIRPDE